MPPQKQQESLSKVPLAGTGIRPELVSTPSPPHQRFVLVPTHYDAVEYNTSIMSARKALDRLDVPEDGWRYVLLRQDDWKKAAQQQIAPGQIRGNQAFSNLSTQTTYLNESLFHGRDLELMEVLAHEFAHRTYVDESKAEKLAATMVERVRNRKKSSEK